MVTAGRSRSAEALHDYARIHRRVVKSLAEAERAVTGSAERELARIERTLGVGNPPRAEVRPPPGASTLPERFLCAAAYSLGFSSEALLFVIDRAYVGVLFGGTDREVIDLHFRFGEGPVIDAWEAAALVEVADFARTTTRWPAFAPAALEIGVRSVLCVPLPTDQADLVLTFWGSQPIPTLPRSWMASRTLARATGPRFSQLQRVILIARRLLSERPELITTGSFQLHIHDTVTQRAVVYQAAGLLAGRLSIDPKAALDLLRIQAWADQRPLEDLCGQMLSEP